MIKFPILLILVAGLFGKSLKLRGLGEGTTGECSSEKSESSEHGENGECGKSESSGSESSGQGESSESNVREVKKMNAPSYPNIIQKIDEGIKLANLAKLARIEKMKKLAKLAKLARSGIQENAENGEYSNEDAENGEYSNEDAETTPTESYNPISIKRCDIRGRPGTRGNKGRTGKKGPYGSTGPQGLQGNQGTQGPQGNQGTQGIPGPFGNIGLNGLKGPVGDPGVPSGSSPAGNPGIEGPVGPLGAYGPEGPRGLNCDCAKPIVYTRKLSIEKIWSPINDTNFEIVSNDLGETLYNVEGIVIATANGGMKIPNLCNASMELNFFTKESTNTPNLFTNATPSQNGLTPGSAYFKALDSDLILPFTLQQATRVKSANITLNLYAKGKAGTNFYGLGCQYIYFPICRVN